MPLFKNGGQELLSLGGNYSLLYSGTKMMKSDYVIENGQLVVRELHSRKIVWNSSFEMPVFQIVPLHELDGCLALLDPGVNKKPTFENLFMVGSDGVVRWRAQLPSSHDAFVNVVERDTGIEAQACKGQFIEIDSSTGQTRSV
jgi:hypothetical protein